MTEGTRPRLLYIDDDAGLRRLVERALTRKGYDVTLAESGDAVLEALARATFDAVALDHFMPGKEGLEVLDSIRMLPDPPPVIYASGSDEGRIAIAALKAGAADYVIKDVGGVFMELLENAIANAVDQARARRAAAEAEREIREARDRAEMLLREVNHRVANSLALVGSFVYLQQRALGAEQEGAKAALGDVQARISAIAQIHRRLYTSDDISQIDLEPYLGGLIEELSATMGGEGNARTVRLDVAPVRMATDRAVSLGVIVTELVTNAFKYAYPRGETGEIRVALRQEAAELSLTVEDDGVGMAPGDKPKGTGLGTRIVRAMAASLQAKQRFDPAFAGTRIILSMPAGVPA